MKLRAYYQRNKLSIANKVYWILLLYVIAALIWWYFELQQQNNEMMQFQRNLLQPSDPSYSLKLNAILDQHHRNQLQYLGEGLTFLALIILGSIFVYRAVRRQFRLNEQQQNFMMAITHELKTPIAITRLNLETLQRHQLDPARQQKLIDVSLQETGRLNDLCENILVTTRMESGRYERQAEKIDLSELLKVVYSSMQNRFPKRTIHSSLPAGIIIHGDPFLLHLLFNNLLENALKYSPADTPVWLYLEKTAANIRVSVVDLGVGIPAADKEKIFSKFYRAGNENTRRTKGTGLGLYLSQKIAGDHHTRITVSDNQPAGSIFAIEF
jgi:K+-sensing histidine kinase KdpD